VRFGARTAPAPVLIDLVFLLLGVGFGEDGYALLKTIPDAVLGSLLMFSGIELALSSKPQDYRDADLFRPARSEICSTGDADRRAKPGDGCMSTLKPIAKSLSEVTRPKRRHKGGDAQARQEAGPGSVRAVNLEAELAQLGLLPTVEDPIIYRGLGKPDSDCFYSLRPD